MLSLGCILISDLVVTDLFMHSLSGMILLYLAAPLFYTNLKVFLREILFTGNVWSSFTIHIATIWLAINNLGGLSYQTVYVIMNFV